MKNSPQPPLEFSTEQCNQPSTPNIFDLLLDLCTSVQEGLETLLDIVNVVIGCHARLVAVGIQAYIQVSNPEANIIPLIRLLRTMSSRRPASPCRSQSDPGSPRGPR
jgi:hypothetical protein